MSLDPYSIHGHDALVIDDEVAKLEESHGEDAGKERALIGRRLHPERLMEMRAQARGS